MVLPFLELLFEVVGRWLEPRPKLSQCGALGTLDFTVKLRRPRFVGPTLDRPIEKSPLNFGGEEFAAASGLRPLNREGRLLDNFIEEMQGICPSAPREQPDHDIAAAIIHCGVLITTRSYRYPSAPGRPELVGYNAGGDGVAGGAAEDG